MQEVQRDRVYTRYSETGARWNGGDYDFWTDRYIDFWTGQTLSEEYRSSADFDLCPWCGHFSSTCHEEEREMLYTKRQGYIILVSYTVDGTDA